MPIDFPTRKLADRATTTPTAPAADDTLQGQTVGGTDRVFLLGNLAGLAPLTIANDQAPYFAGGSWGSYSLTAAGRALSAVAGTANTFPYFSAANVVTLGAVGATGLTSLAAANAAAGRTAIGAADDANVVHRTGDESIAGLKTFTAASRWNLGTVGSVQFSTPSNYPGILFRYGDPAGGDELMYRSEIRGGNGFMQIFVNNAMSSAAGTRGVAIVTNAFAPLVTATMSLGTSPLLWTQVFAQNATINTSDARLKTEPRQLRDAEFKAASTIARLPAVWRWIHRVEGDEQNEPEGREARKHFGPTVQAAIAVMEAHGLDPFAYSFICYDQWEAEDATYDEDGNETTPAREAGDRYSFRKEELLCFLASALAVEVDQLRDALAAQAAELASAMDLVQQLMDRVAALEAKLTA